MLAGMCTGTSDLSQLTNLQTRHCHSESTGDIRVSLGVACSVGLGKCWMTCVHIIASHGADSLPQTLWVPLVSPPPSPWQPVIFSDWLLSLNNMHLRCPHVFSRLESSFLYPWTIFHRLVFPVYPSPTEGHLVCFQVRAIRNKAVTRRCVQIFLWTYVFTSFG